MRTATTAAAGAVFGIFLFAPAAAVAASFDCVQAKAPVEHLICNDPVLSRLDERMAEAYAARKASARDSQRVWLRERLDACAIPAKGAVPSTAQVWAAAPCLVGQYRQRLEALGAPDPAAPAPKDGPAVHPLCLSEGLGFGDRDPFGVDELAACVAGTAHIPVEPGREGGWEAYGLSWGFPTWTSAKPLDDLPDGRKSWLLAFNTGGTGVFTSVVATGANGIEVMVPGGDRCMGGITAARLEDSAWIARLNAVGEDIARVLGVPEGTGGDLPYCSVCCAGEVEARFPLDGGAEEVIAIVPPAEPLRDDASPAERCLALAVGDNPLPASAFAAAKEQYLACLAR